MKSTFALLTAFTALTTAAPSLLQDRSFQTVNLTFHAAAASYDLSIPADGEFHSTNHPDLNINIIDTPIFSAITNCEFQTPETVALASSYSSSGTPEVLVGPPQPVTAVKCWGSCVPIYSDCYINGVSQGGCCSGYCAANKCRPFPQFE